MKRRSVARHGAPESGGGNRETVKAPSRESREEGAEQSTEVTELRPGEHRVRTERPEHRYQSLSTHSPGVLYHLR